MMINKMLIKFYFNMSVNDKKLYFCSLKKEMRI